MNGVLRNLRQFFQWRPQSIPEDPKFSMHDSILFREDVMAPIRSFDEMTLRPKLRALLE